MRWRGGEAFCSSIENCNDPALRWRLGLPPAVPKRGTVALETSGSEAAAPSAAKAFAAARSQAKAIEAQQTMMMMTGKGKGKGWDTAMGSWTAGPYSQRW